jgi:hypothetical protein
MATASLDVDSSAKQPPRSTFALARSAGYASLIALAVGLWGTLATEVWRADDAAMAEARAEVIEARQHAEVATLGNPDHDARFHGIAASGRPGTVRER